MCSAPTGAETQQKMVLDKVGDQSVHGQTCLERLISVFEQQADTFLLHKTSVEDYPISSLGEYDGFDDSEAALNSMEGNEDAGPLQGLPLMVSHGSGMDSLDPEDHPILLPSSLGWKWCHSHGAKSVAEREAQLCNSQANDSIHQICLALGFKSAIFHTQVQPAKTQKTKTHAWQAVHNVDAIVQEHAWMYCMAQDAYHNLHSKSGTAADLPLLLREDLNTETLVLGSEVTGQWNKQQSWIWGFGQTTEDHGSWMDDCKLLQCYLIHFNITFGCLHTSLLIAICWNSESCIRNPMYAIYWNSNICHVSES